MHYCVLMDGELHGNDRKIITKAGQILGRRFDVHTTPLTGANMAGYCAHQGGKFLFDYQASFEHPFVLAATTSGRLRERAIKTVPGYLRLSTPEKRAALVAMACLYGLEGKACTKFILTNINYFKFDKSSCCLGDKMDTCLVNRLAIKTARMIGIRIFNTTERKDVALLAGLLKRI